MSDAAPQRGRQPVAFLRALNGQRVRVMGCEREPVAAVIAAGAGLLFLAFATLSPVAGAAGFAFWTGGLWALRKAARHDPMFFRLYRRSVRYKAFYPARSTRWARR